MLFRIATTALLLTGTSASAQDGFDFDTLAACSIVYQQVGSLFAAQGNGIKSAEFQNTAYAYSASAHHVLQYSTNDQQQAAIWGEKRMSEVSDSLLDAVENHPDGEMGVIDQWLPYCDTLGAGVTELLARREQSGW